MSVNVPYLNTTIPPTGGANAFAGQGETYSFNLTLPLTGNPGEVTIVLTSTVSGVQTQIGFGNVTGENFTYCATYNNKVYGLAGGTVFISAVNDPTTWNNPNGVGNGFITLANWYATTEDLLALSPYQGRLVFFSRRTAQIWLTDPNLSNWEIIQTLTNIGTLAPLSVQALGDLDVLFLSDTGIRSLRVRDNTLNAFVTDIGSPIDTLIQTALLQNNYSGACGIVDPEQNNYWCFLNGVIYVLSFFPSNKISAWGTFLPTYPSDLVPSASSYPGSGAPTVTYTAIIGRSYYWLMGTNEVSLTDGINVYTKSVSFFATTTTFIVTGKSGLTVTCTLEEQIPFTPAKFVVFDGQVFTRDSVAFYQYGGTNNDTYDGTIAIAATAWMDLGTPGNLKKADAIDAVFIGTWTISAGLDWQGFTLNSGTLTNVCTYLNQPTFQIGEFPFSGDGYHLKMQGQSSGNQLCTLSSLIFHFNQAEEK